MHSISFPPERKKPKNNFNGVVIFQMGVLAKHPDLLSEVMGLHQTHDAIELEDRRTEFEELQNEADMFVQGAQDAKRFLEKVTAEHFEATKRYEQLSDALRSASNELEQFKAEIEDSEDDTLLTRKQEQERNSKLQTYSESVGNARLLETEALTDLRRAIEAMNAASKAHAAWVYSAQQLKGEVKSLEQAN